MIITEAYHVFMMHLVKAQVKATSLVLKNKGVQRIFVDGGFSRNVIYMTLLAQAFPNSEVFWSINGPGYGIGGCIGHP